MDCHHELSIVMHESCFLLLRYNANVYFVMHCNVYELSMLMHYLLLFLHSRSILNFYFSCIAMPHELGIVIYALFCISRLKNLSKCYPSCILNASLTYSSCISFPVPLNLRAGGCTFRPDLMIYCM